MSANDNAGGDDFAHVFTGQLKQFDDKLSDFRQFYESHSTEEREQLRQWLEQLDASQTAAKWKMNIQIHAENDVLDDKGDLLRWADAVFTPATMLSAISAWDQGDNFTPNSVLP